MVAETCCGLAGTVCRLSEITGVLERRAFQWTSPVDWLVLCPDSCSPVHILFNPTIFEVFLTRCYTDTHDGTVEMNYFT